ncbi:uncharacterized protein LOC133909205 isoform X2 [Phragmites australis]|nr:uncharacterized protein LOC133909205 isoform X2 [Phragmites australis]
MPLTGRGIIQVWCLLAPFEDAHSCQQMYACNKSNRRGRPRKTPDGNNSFGISSNPPKPRGRPRKRTNTTSDDHLEPVLKRPRGRPRKYPLPVAKVEDSSQNSKTQDIVLFDPLAASTVIPDDLPLACVMPAAKAVKSTPTRGRGRQRKIPIDELAGSSVMAICTEPKRTRGRPRKYPVPSNSRSISGIDIELGKDTTCQPVDHTACTEYNANLSIIAVDAALPVIDKLTRSSGTVLKEDVCTVPSPTTATCTEPKRTQGRPQKYPVPSNSRSISDTKIESGKDTTCQPVDLTPCTKSNANLSIVAVDAALPVTSSSTATYGNKSKGQRGRGQNKKEPNSNALCCSVVSGVESRSMSSRETISSDPPVSIENALPSGQSNIVSVTSELCSVRVLSCEGNVQKGVSDDSVLPSHISPKLRNKRESSGRRGRGRPRKKPLSAATSCLVASGANSPKTVSVLASSDNLTALDKSDGEVIANNIGSIGSCGCDIEACSVHLSAVLPDAASPAHGLYNAHCKDGSNTKRGGGGSRKKLVSTKHSHSADFNGEEQKAQTTLKSRDHVALVENCMKGSCPRKGEVQPKKKSASKECNSTSISGEAHTMDRSSTSMTIGSSRSEDVGGLIGFKKGIVGCEVMKVNESNSANDTSHCNIENAQANQVAPIFKNNARVIDEVEATELVPLKESREDGNMFSCIENSNSSPVPKDIALPRVVLCLAHNGKVAWDIKWKPPLLSQSEQKSRLGFLAVLLGNGSLEVWEVPSPHMIQKIYSPSKVEGSDPRFLKLQPVFRCVKVKCGNRQSIPLTVDWSPSPPHDMILAGCHDGTVALWNFSTNLSSQDSKPFMCVTAESVPIRALSWAPYISEENINTFVTAGEDGLKFWDLRDPYRPLWELTTAPRAVLSLHWLKDARGIIVSVEDGTLKFLSLPRIANDVPVTGRPFVGTKTQGVSTYQLSEYLIWSVHASEITGCAAYCGADGTAVHFQLTSRFWEKEPGRNRAPYFLCGSLSEEGENIKIGSTLQKSPLSNVPLGAKKGPKSCQDIVQVQDVEKEKLQITDSGYSCTVNPELGDGQEDEHSEEQGTGEIVLASPTEQENGGIWNSKGGESPKDSEVLPPKAVALHRVRWNSNKGSERWLCYGGAAGIIRCQRI